MSRGRLYLYRHKSFFSADGCKTMLKDALRTHLPEIAPDIGSSPVWLSTYETGKRGMRIAPVGEESLDFSCGVCL